MSTPNKARRRKCYVIKAVRSLLRKNVFANGKFILSPLVVPVKVRVPR